MNQRQFGRLITNNSQQFVINLSGTPQQSLYHIMPSLSCSCGLKKQIQMTVSACLLKIQKLRNQRDNYKSLYKEEKKKTEKLLIDINDWENKYYQMREAAIKKKQVAIPDDNTLLNYNFTLQNTIKELSIKLSRQRTRNRIVTESQNLNSFLNDLKYSNTTTGKHEQSFLLESRKQRNIFSPGKENFNLTTKLDFS